MQKWINRSTRSTLFTKRILPFHEADAGPADGVVEVEAEESSLWPRVGRTALFFALGILLPFLLGQRAHRYHRGHRQDHRSCGGCGRGRHRRSGAVGTHGAGAGLSGASTSTGRPGAREQRVSPTAWHVTRDRDSGTAGIICLCGETDSRVRICVCILWSEIERISRRRECCGRLCSDFLHFSIILCNDVGVRPRKRIQCVFGFEGRRPAWVHKKS